MRSRGLYRGGHAFSAVMAVVLSLAFGGVNASTFTGEVNSDWSTDGNWSPARVPLSTDDVTIPVGKSASVTTDVVCCNLSVSGTLTLGNSSSRPNVSLAATGAIVLSDSAKLNVHAGCLQDLSPYAATSDKAAAVQLALYDNANIISAAGDITFGAGTTTTLSNDPITGTPSIFRGKNITVDAGATITASAGGWSWKKLTSGQSAPANTVVENSHYTYCLGYGSGYWGGASYGGAGKSASRTYGFSYAPLLPGSSGGCNYDSWSLGCGGGTICLQAADKLTVSGTLTSKGALNQICGSSGGGIWLCGAELDFESAVQIMADGADNNKHYLYAAGGGGRVALCEGFSDEELRTMAGGTLPSALSTKLTLSNVTAKGGVNSGSSGSNGSAGTTYKYQSGNAYAIIGFSSPGMPDLYVPGIPTTSVSRRYGETSFDIPAYALLASNTNGVRYAYAGYVVSNDTSEVAHGDASRRHASFTTTKDCANYTLYMLWSSEAEYGVRVVVPDACGQVQFGTDELVTDTACWVTPGGTCTVRFTPADGYTFGGWSGNYPRSHALANPATLKLDAPALLTPIVTGGTGETNSWKGGTGSWDDATKWSLGRVPTILDDVSIAAGTVNAEVSLLAKSLTMTAGTLNLGKDGSLAPMYAAVMGDATFSGSAVVNVQASRTETFDKTSQTTLQSSLYDAANTLRIAGKLSVGSGVKITVANDILIGVPVVFRVGSFEVLEGGTVTATGKGFGWLKKGTGALFEGTYNQRLNYGYSSAGDICSTHAYGRGSGYGVGAGYGGKGSAGSGTFGGAGSTYGFQYAPLLPGAPSDLYCNNLPRGGGTICVLASGAVTVAGTISAIGARNSQLASCSGGGIWLAGSSVTVGDNGKITADGEANGNFNYGAGGGGRIAFAIGLEDAMLDALADGGDPEAYGMTTTDIVSAQVTVAGGANASNVYRKGSDGTKKQVFDPSSITTINVTANPSEYVADDVVYGKSSVYYGSSSTFTAPDWAYNTTARTDSRYAYAGYVVSNATEEVAARGADTKSVTIDFVKGKGPYELRWKWGARETHHTVTVPDGTLGTVTVNGSAYTTGSAFWSPEGRTDEIVATPAADCEFVCWTGDVPVADSLSPTLRISAATAYKIAAVFRRMTAERVTYHWTKGATGYWDDVSKWDEGNLPGAEDDVVIGAGTCTARNRLEVRSLTLTNAASLTVKFCPDVKIATDCILRNTATLRIVATPTDAGHTWTNGATIVRIGGLFSLTNSATLYPESDAYSGGSPVFYCKRFELFDTAKINAVGLGFGGTYAGQWVPVKNLCPNPHAAGAGYQVGGGYGGRGGNVASATSAGWTFGLPLSPIHPGSPNGVYSYDANGSSLVRGGGLVRIHAERLRIDGTIDASGNGHSYGGASGGGIWLTGRWADSFRFASTATLSVKGGHSGYASPNPNSKGGGGRIAIGTGLTAADCEAMVAAGAYPGRPRHVMGYEAFTNRYGAVTVDLNPGDNWSSKEEYRGTFRFVDGTRTGFMLLVR